MAEELNKLAYFTHRFLEREANGGLVRTMSRVERTWKAFQDEKDELSEAFIKSLVSAEERKTDENQAKRAHKFNSQIDVAVEIFNAGADYWMTVYTQLSKEDVLSWGELDFIQNISKYISKGKLPTSAQCKRLVKIITKAEDFGYIMPKQ